MVSSTKFAKDGNIYPMRIISVNVGLPSAQLYEGRELITGGAKQPVPRAVLRFENFDGDRQADQVNHGGFEKAVCVYPFEHYPYWSKRLGRDLKPGAFSEDLTVSGAIETEVCGRRVPDRGSDGAGQPTAHAVRQAGKQEWVEDAAQTDGERRLHGLLYACVV